MALTQGTYGVKTDTGLLRASFGIGAENNVYEVKGQGNTFSGTLGSNVIYARVQEYGGVITPKKSKYLAIPLNKDAKGESPRNIPGLFFMKSKGGSLLAAIKNGKEIIPMYLMKTSVTIKPHYYVQNTMLSSLSVIQKIMSTAMDGI
jgi:hypothetical protein